MIATAINDRLQRKLDYVEEERRILREKLDAVTGGKKILFTAEQRRRLATAGKLLTVDDPAGVASIDRDRRGIPLRRGPEFGTWTGSRARRSRA
jgi:hypothetical protein